MPGGLLVEVGCTTGRPVVITGTALEVVGPVGRPVDDGTGFVGVCTGVANGVEVT